MLEEKIREFVSKKALDFSENLPKFQGGIIHRMQRVRATEREIATESATLAKCPDDVKIELESISMLLVYEFENFEKVHSSLQKLFPREGANKRALQKLFPRNKKIAKIINDIRNSQNDIDGASWSEIGLITREREEYYFIDRVEKSTLPDLVSRVLVSHFKLLPSLACLQFRVMPSDEVKKSLNSLAERTYLNHTVSSSIMPRKIFKGYHRKFENVAAAVVSEKIQSVVKITNKWLMKELGINPKNIDESVIHPLYKIVHGLPINIEEFSKENSIWLSKYGFSLSK